LAIDRDLVIRTALRLLDENGLEHLSLRRLAGELQVKAPALYWYFESKRALMDHMADAVLAPAMPELDGPADPADWPAWLDHTASVLRARLLAHPDGAQLALGVDLSRAPALRRFVERTIEVLDGAGFGLADASRAAATFIWFVVGRTVEEQSLPDQLRGRSEAAAPGGPALTGESARSGGSTGSGSTLSAGPALAGGSILARAMAERAAPDDQEVSFRFGVRVMIAGMQALLREVAPGSDTAASCHDLKLSGRMKPT
jgi:TetR/AcrR family transcriptional regulator, tetracycline repressor protein